MNRRKNEVHAALVAEHRRLLSDHSRLRNVALGQSQEINRLRGIFPWALLILVYCFTFPPARSFH